MKQIVILMALLTWGAEILSQCHSPGSITLEQHGDSIEIKHTELPYPCVEPEWERVVWFRACNPYNYHQRSAIDTLDVGEPLWLDADEPYMAIWGQYQYKAAELFVGGAAMSSNTVQWVTEMPSASVTIMPNPNDGNFLLDLESNGTGGVFRIYGGIGGMVLSKTFTGGSKEEQVSIPDTWLNPNGVYEVVADFFFDGCVDSVRVREKFILNR